MRLTSSVHGTVSWAGSLAHDLPQLVPTLQQALIPSKWPCSASGRHAAWLTAFTSQEAPLKGLAMPDSDIPGVRVLQLHMVVVLGSQSGDHAFSPCWSRGGGSNKAEDSPKPPQLTSWWTAVRTCWDPGHPEVHLKLKPGQSNSRNGGIAGACSDARTSTTTTTTPRRGRRLVRTTITT